MATWSPARPSHELVRSAGAKSARAVQHLNYPSYTSSQKHREGATIADSSNPCLKLVLGTGFTPQNSFLFDDFNRREHRHGLEKYSTQTSRLHLDLSNEYRQNINAKVEIVWGKKAKVKLINKLGDRLQALPLWGPDFHDVTVHLEYIDADDVCSKRRQGANAFKRVFRIIVFVHHPEYFYHDWRVSISVICSRFCCYCDYFSHLAMGFLMVV